MNIAADSPRSPRPKSVLFCPACDFESPVSDGWLVVSDGGERAVVCPECGCVVDRRTERSASVPPQPAD